MEQPRALREEVLRDALAEERRGHGRVLGLLRRQRLLLTQKRWAELADVNSELLSAVEEACQATRQRVAAERESGLRAIEVAPQIWMDIRRTSRLVQQEAELNEGMATELWAEAQFALDFLHGAVSYDSKGRWRADSISLMDRAA